MSDSINWHNLSDKDKTQLILEKVIGCSIFENEKAFKEHMTEARKGHASSTQWPIAYWDESIGVGHWYIFQDTAQDDTQIFDPLHDMNDAWQVVERINELPSDGIEAQLMREQMAAKSRFMIWFEYAKLWAMSKQEAAEAICVEALRAKGMEVIA